MPKIGSTMETGTVVKWLKAVGDPVAKDEPVVEIETEKVASTVESPIDGTVAEILVAEDEEVPVATTLAWIKPLDA